VNPEELIERDREWRFWAKVDRRGADECWPWLGKVAGYQGYGRFSWEPGRVVGAHVAMLLMIGVDVPSGMQVDHTCHNRDLSCNLLDRCPHRACVNPAHLEVVTGKVNRSRSPSAQMRRGSEFCMNGHRWTPENTHTTRDGYRSCRACGRDRDRIRDRSESRRKALARDAEFQCVVCERPFMTRRHVPAATCSPGCRSELGRRAANKRWHAEPQSV
jgi:hypothetical protein